jgi:hypothetical protein
MFSTTLATVSTMSPSVRPAARTLEIAVANFTALHYNGASKLQNSVGLFDRGLSMASPGYLLFCKTNFAADECVRAETAATHVALGDSQGDLSSNLRVEAAAGE